ncbi:hypothetical protein AGABI1DRAFT_128708 [Agaricus bisporus var. burnettii JB137-S8]|uniref:BTB domain-containing protein n=1 Tax=Agaricus bisporus var. burnettii (strain JB137-S8 / ATCC MYA-4627 / FGSC 10392) TaxID=597362 RepID=K5WVQ5_AGABU|nr:uncharacterized protein AGABI1DRAFT_128708 [Agaricus bisporus var. burnettii JB137-S8]EKM79561.1 hypothetical protein AGABI1DRAFT_128708 [Agaricus bisporus var. burnettii JB137-S8]
MPSSESSASSMAVVPDSSDPRPTHDDLVSKSVTNPTPSSVIRDEDYYWCDGNCVIRVQDRLFKIHRYLLDRDSEFFRTLFTLPQSKSSDDENQEFIGQGMEGQSDENPIVCQDSVEDLKALFWALYARPKEIAAQEDWKTMDMANLLRVIFIAHKYEFESLRDWSLSVVGKNSLSNASRFVDSCGGWNLNVERLLIICHERQQYTLSKNIKEYWLKQIGKPNEDWLVRLRTFKAALDFAEKYPYSRTFHGKAYYIYLQTCNVFDGTPGVE